MLIECDVLPVVEWWPTPRFQLEAGPAVYRVQLAQNESYAPALRPLLRADELARATRYFREEDQLRFLVARAMLRLLVGKYTAKNPVEIEFGAGLTKKPFAEGVGNLRYNVSHSGNWILLAFASTEVGIDVEQLKPDFQFQEVLAHSFNAPERLFIEYASASRELFYQAWTRKEALAKALALGVAADFRDLPALDGRHWLGAKGDRPAEQWRVRSFAAAAQYPAAVAYPAALAPPQFYEADAGLLLP